MPERIKELYQNDCTFEEYVQLSRECIKTVFSKSRKKEIDFEDDDYILYTIDDKEIRPLSKKLFAPEAIDSAFNTSIFVDPKKSDYAISVLYTLQRSFGCYLDYSADQQAARKIVGQIFEGLFRSIFKELGYNVHPGELSLGIVDDEVHFYDSLSKEKKGDKVKLSFDALINTNKEPVRDHKSVIIGFKTTTKDRGNMFFVDKHVYKQANRDPDCPKFIAIILNDVQRKKTKGKTTGVSSTYLPGHHQLYQTVFDPLDGFYYIEPPRKNANSRIKLITDLFQIDLPKWVK